MGLPNGRIGSPALQLLGRPWQIWGSLRISGAAAVLSVRLWLDPACHGFFLGWPMHPAEKEITKSSRNNFVSAALASPGRFERPTFRLGGGCSIQLSYGDRIAVLSERPYYINENFAFCQEISADFLSSQEYNRQESF